MKSLPLIAISMLVSGVALACNAQPDVQGSASTQPTEAVPDDWLVHSSPGIDIALPVEWVAFSLQSEQIDQALEDLVDEYPGFAPSLELARQGMASGTYTFFALDSRSATDFGRNINVVRTRASMGRLPATLSPREIDELEEILADNGMSLINVRVIEVAERNVLWMSGGISVAGPDGNVVGWDTLQAMIPDVRGYDYTITLSTDLGTASSQGQFFEQVIQAMTFTR